MIDATALRADKNFLFQNIPYRVVKYTHQKLGRGGGVVKLVVRNLSTGAKEELTFDSTVRFEEIETVKKTAQFLYSDSKNAYFMDSVTFEQYEIPLRLIKDEIMYIKEGDNVSILFWEDRPLSFEIPPKVTLLVKETGPGVRGNSATNIFKEAILENGLKIKVPLFINVGDRVVVDTRTGEYVERAK